MKKMNNNGFTVVELLTSFALASVVMILLTNILLTIKENYLQNKMEVELESQVALLSRTLNEIADVCPVKAFGSWGTTIDFAESSSCDLSAMKLTFANENEKLVATVTTFDKSNKKLGDDKYEFPKSATVDNTKIVRQILSTDTYLLIEFDINATLPMTGAKKTKTVKVLYKY